MQREDQVPDKTLLKTVQRKLLQKCAGARVSAAIQGGEAIITGSIANEYERKQILKCVSAVQGVGRVIDQIQLIEKKKRTE